MIFYMSMALLNGMVIGASRAVNGQLSTRVGALKASLWNHVIGFLFLTLILMAMSTRQFPDSAVVPFSAYLGGFFGALFVAVNSYVFPRLGATKAALLVIGGQMISAVLMDWLHQGTTPGALRCLGVVTVLLGMYLSGKSHSSPVKDKEND